MVINPILCRIISQHNLSHHLVVSVWKCVSFFVFSHTTKFFHCVLFSDACDCFSYKMTYFMFHNCSVECCCKEENGDQEEVDGGTEHTDFQQQLSDEKGSSIQHIRIPLPGKPLKFRYLYDVLNSIALVVLNPDISVDVLCDIIPIYSYSMISWICHTLYPYLATPFVPYLTPSISMHTACEHAYRF